MFYTIWYHLCNCEKHPWRSVTFSKVAGFFTKSNTPPWVLFMFLNCTNGTESRQHITLWYFKRNIRSMRLVRNENERGTFLLLSNSWDVSFLNCVWSMKLVCYIFVIFQDNLTTENFLSFIALLLHIVNQSYWMLVWAAEIANKDV